MAAIFPSDRNLQLSDITTGNVSTTKHGFVPKATGVTTDFLAADGTYRTPAGGGSSNASVIYCRLATNAALPTNTYLLGVLTGVSTGVLTVDGVTVAVNDVLLVKNEATGANNGIYTCTIAGALGVAYVFTRHTSMDSSGEFVGVIAEIGTEGSFNSRTVWRCTNTTAPTVGTTAITFAEQRISLNVLPSICQGRLTLESGVAYSSSDQTAKTTIYWTPLNGDRVAVYSGSAWYYLAFTEISVALGTLVNAMGYDVFCYDNSGTLALEVAEWKNASVTMTLATPCVVTWTAHGLVTGNSITFTTSGVLPTGIVANTQYWVNRINDDTFNIAASTALLAAGTYIASSITQSGTHTGHMPHVRQTALTTQNGVYVKSGDTTRRYLGSFMTTATTTTEDSKAKRFLWNLNSKPRSVRVQEATNTWTYSTDAWRQTNAAVANQIAVFAGLTASDISVTAMGEYSWNNASSPVVGIGEDAVTVATTESVYIGQTAGSSGALGMGIAQLNKTVSLGYRWFAWLERGQGVATVTWIGDNGATRIQTGMNGTWEC